MASLVAPKHVIEIFDLDGDADGDGRVGYRVIRSDELIGTCADYLVLSLKNTLAIIGQEVE